MKTATKSLSVDSVRLQILVKDHNPRSGRHETNVYQHRRRNDSMELLKRLASGHAVEDQRRVTSQVRWIEQVLKVINQAEKTNFSLQSRWVQDRKLPEIVLVGG